MDYQTQTMFSNPTWYLKNWTVIGDNTPQKAGWSYSMPLQSIRYPIFPESGPRSFFHLQEFSSSQFAPWSVLLRSSINSTFHRHLYQYAAAFNSVA